MESRACWFMRALGGVSLNVVNREAGHGTDGKSHDLNVVSIAKALYQVGFLTKLIAIKMSSRPNFLTMIDLT